ncbi:zona pellucida sperm-binding protein 3 [Tachysurus fulvidraco]|uniref:zona pellucida sperm-binding protein 3 n=1 Tax=Tachysurus fulvidraco TaxID=1234273 RepID=UPI001FED54F2|nr:zona pellucida sperm-binding protein 3 [Tachysurus fulvidraco]
MQRKMLLKVVVLLVGMSYMVSPSFFVTNTASDDTWPEVEETFPHYKVKDPVTPSPVTPCPPLKLPESQPIAFSAVRKNMFSPVGNRRAVPKEMKDILLPSVTKAPLTPQPKSVQLLCHIDRIYVRVQKSLFSNANAEKHLKVGTCLVNKDTPEYYYFLYPINSCNVQRHENQNRVLYSNTLSYEPVADDLVIRELPFSVQLECYYNKHFRSYSIGYQPQVEAGTVFMSLQGVVSLIPVDDTWKPYSTVQSYTVGQPMYFEAKAPESLTGKRIYLNKCYVSASQNPDATPKYTVIDNYGCMVDSKISQQSKFYPSDKKTTLRFSIGALMFKNAASQPADKNEMFIHCDLTVGNEAPTASIKSCLYDAGTQGWSELYGESAVCACCDSSCPAPEPAVTMKISSNAWLVEKHMTDQPATKSLDLPEDIMDRGGFEMFWDTFDDLAH